MKTNDLLPCPFCGGSVELELCNETTSYIYGPRKWWGVKCRNTINRGGTCAIEQVPSASEEAAIERWNMRAPLAATAPESAPADAPVAPRNKLIPMQNEEGKRGWYFDCDEFYVDIDLEDDGTRTLYFRDRLTGMHELYSPHVEPIPAPSQSADQSDSFAAFEHDCAYHLGLGDFQRNKHDRYTAPDVTVQDLFTLWSAIKGHSADQVRDAAPWPDFLGQTIHHGDRLAHPDGNTFVAIRLEGHPDEGDAWRAVYDYDPAHVSRLSMQIGDKGHAVLATSSAAKGTNPA